MRQSVVDRLVSLQAQLGEAKGHYEDEMDAYEVNPHPFPVPIPNPNLSRTRTRTRTRAPSRNRP